MNKRISKILVVIFTSIILTLLVLFFLNLFSTVQLKSKAHYIKHQENDMILYKLGVKEYTDKIIIHLPAAIQRVEFYTTEIKSINKQRA